MTRILIVDDHEVVCSGLRMILESQPGWLVLAIPGLLIAWLGRTRRARVFVRQDQF